MFDDFDDDDYAQGFDLLDGSDIGPAIGAPPQPSLLPPRESATLIGHRDHERALLQLFNNGHLPHALILAGSKGIGKATFAFRLARFLLRHGGAGAGDQDALFGPEEAPGAAESFDVAADDPVFRRVASGGHPDLLVVERPLDEKKGTRKAGVDVDTVRKITPFLRMTASEGGWRVVIVDDAETMNRNAQNAVLKILEEPPAQTLLILVCHRLGAMIPTIRSRCRTLHFAPLGPDALRDLLYQGAPEMSAAETALLLDMAEGSAGRALNLYEEGGIKALDDIVALLEGRPSWDWPQIHALADNLGRFGGDDSYKSFVEAFTWLCESILRAQAAGPDRWPRALEGRRTVEEMRHHYSLEQWIGICDKLKAHFAAIDQGNLDKRQGVIGAFAILGGA